MNAGEWELVNDLFHAARRLTGNKRAAFLEQAHAEHLELANQLDELLAADARADSFALDRPADLAGATAAADVFRPDERAGAYRIVREIGRGGMGIVYLAEDQVLRSPVALKVLLPGLPADAERRERLRREAEAARRLSHPAIATVYAFHDFDGIACIAYEYVNGRTLRDHLRDGRMPLADVIAIGLDIAGALSVAQENGITHRDLKPENVMRTPGGRVKVLDFGLALLDPACSAGANGRLTRENMIVGTPSYMAPEQLRFLAVDHRTDIFLLGVLLHELASGVHPFETSDCTLTMARILVSDPRRLPIASADLDRVIRKCLQKAPEERYQSARDLGTDLEQIRANTGEGSRAPDAVVAARQKSGQAWRAWWRTHQIVMAIAYTILIIAAGIALGSGLIDSDALFATIVCAALIGIMARLHLAFHDRLDPQTTAGRLRSLRWLLWVCDGVLTLALLSASVVLLGSHRVVAAVVLAIAGAFAFTFAVIEPATTARAFRRRPSSSDLRHKSAPHGR